MEIEIKEIGGNLLKNLPKAKSISESQLADGLNEASGLIWQRSIETTPTSTGTLKKSIMRELSPTYARIYPELKYGLYVHEGTKPHAIPKVELQEGGSLYRWAKKKGLNPYAVANAIRRKGTKGQPWLLEAYNQNWKKAEAIMLDHLDKLVNRLIG